MYFHLLKTSRSHFSLSDDEEVLQIIWTFVLGPLVFKLRTTFSQKLIVLYLFIEI